LCNPTARRVVGEQVSPAPHAADAWAAAASAAYHHTTMRPAPPHTLNAPPGLDGPGPRP